MDSNYHYSEIPQIVSDVKSSYKNTNKIYIYKRYLTRALNTPLLNLGTRYPKTFQCIGTQIFPGYYHKNSQVHF